MIALTLRIPSDIFPTVNGQDAGKFLLDMLKEHPKLAVDAAEEIEVKGDFGTFRERREQD